MNTWETANKLVELVKQHRNLEAVQTLYADDVVNVEAMAMPGHPQQVTGKDAVLKKNQWWVDNHQIHSQTVTGPWPHDDRFIVHYKIDVTAKAGPMQGKRFSMEEAALYTVKNGKVVKEEFFYAPCQNT